MILILDSLSNSLFFEKTCFGERFLDIYYGYAYVCIWVFQVMCDLLPGNFKKDPKLNQKKSPLIRYLQEYYHNKTKEKQKNIKELVGS